MMIKNQQKKRNKEVIFKNCAPSIECTNEINNTKRRMQKI